MAEAIRVFNPDRKLQHMQTCINRSFDGLIRDLNVRRNLLLLRIEQMREDYRINSDLGNAMKELIMWKNDLKSNLLRSFRKKIELIGQEQLMTGAVFFTIDKKGNFLITDGALQRINIFSPKGVLIHILGAGHLPYLFGIALDKFDWIICVCHSKECFIKF